MLKTGHFINVNSKKSTTYPLSALSIIFPTAPERIKTNVTLSFLYSFVLGIFVIAHTSTAHIIMEITSNNHVFPLNIPNAAPLFSTKVKSINPSIKVTLPMGLS